MRPIYTVDTYTETEKKNQKGNKDFNMFLVLFSLHINIKLLYIYIALYYVRMFDF